VRVVALFIIVGLGLVSTIVGINSILSMTYGQSASNETSSNNATAGGAAFTIDIRGISSFTEPNMVALISTENEVQAKKVDLDKAIIQPGEEKSYSPNKMIDVTIQMSKPVRPNTEVMACVLQLGSSDFSQRVKCNTVFSGAGNTAEPLKIIVPL
jgi:hypothetical protein